MGKRLLASASRGMRIFIQSMGWRLVAAGGDIDLRALRDSINLLARLGISRPPPTGSRCRPGSSSSSAAARQHHLWRGRHHASHGRRVGVIRTASYALITAQRGAAAFPPARKPGQGNLELFNRYANRTGIGGEFRVEDALGKAVAGRLNARASRRSVGSHRALPR